MGRLADRRRDVLFSAGAGTNWCTQVRSGSLLAQASEQLGGRAVRWDMRRYSRSCVRLAPAGRVDGGGADRKGSVRWWRGSDQGSSRYGVRPRRQFGQFLGRYEGSWQLPPRLSGG